MSPGVFEQPFPTLTPAESKAYTSGAEVFARRYVRSPEPDDRPGLGPLFNSNSCMLCHAGNGGGATPKEHLALFSVLIRLSIPGEDAHGGPLPDPNYGGQLNPAAQAGLAREGLAYRSLREIRSLYPDGSAYVLRQPRYRFEQLGYGPMSAEILFSPRIAPRIVGLGLLQAIPKSTLLRRERRQREFGLSGHVNWVWDELAQQRRPGRFGWKANQPTIEQQSAGAFLGDMGLTTSLFSGSSCAPLQTKCRKLQTNSIEVSDADLADLVDFVTLNNPPPRRYTSDVRVRTGEKLFAQVGCAHCHVSTVLTGEFPVHPELSRKHIHPYTDLLVHDMGEGLADHRPDFQANGNEWRTPPLWGVGRAAEVSKKFALLHDGRAESFEEAILWHAGEADNAKQGFMNLNDDKRQALIRFLESL